MWRRGAADQEVKVSAVIGLAVLQAEGGRVHDVLSIHGSKGQGKEDDQRQQQ